MQTLRVLYLHAHIPPAGMSNLLARLGLQRRIEATHVGGMVEQWLALCNSSSTQGHWYLHQMPYRPADRTALASTVASVTMGPIAAWPARLLPHVPCRDARPRQPAATHTPKAPLAAEQLYAVAAALLADGKQSFVH